MPKNRLKQWLPRPEELRKNKFIAMFAPFLADTRLWYMNRNSLIKAIFIGTLCAFFPLPGQMTLALIGALIVRANIPMSVTLTWLTNPITALPVYWFAYWVGAMITGEPAISPRTIGNILTATTSWLINDGENPFVRHSFFSIKAFVLGLITTSIITSAILSLLFNLFWRYRIVKDWQKRQGYQPHAPKFKVQKNSKKTKG